MEIKVKNIITQLVKEHVASVQAIYLFGSQVMHEASLNSDLDLAFLTSHGSHLTATEIFQIKIKLEAALGVDVDLIHLNQASTVFQFQITTTAKHLYVKDADLVLQYEALVLSMYQRLHEERKEILNEIIASGRVYT